MLGGHILVHLPNGATHFFCFTDTPMNHSVVKESLSYWVANPREISGTDLHALQEAVGAYPYCQALHVLRAKGTALHAPDQAAEAIHQAAAHALSRNALRKLIQEEFEWSEKLLAQITGSGSAFSVPADFQSDTVFTLPNRLVKDVNSRYRFDEEKFNEFLNEKLKTQSDLKPIDYADTIPPVDETTLLENNLQTDLEQSAELPQLETTPQDEVELTAENEAERQRQRAIIENFIQRESTLAPIRGSMTDRSEHEDLTKRNRGSIDGIVTESFARILVRQGKIDKAIEVYEKLMLKNPEKSNLFAEKIKELTNE